MINEGALGLFNDVESGPGTEGPAALAAISQEPGGAGAAKQRLAILREVVPGTLRSLYVVRITLYLLAAILAIGKVLLSPTVSAFFLDLLTDTRASRSLLENWVHALQLLVSGALAGSLSLVIATFLIQARLLSQVKREPDVTKNSAEPKTPVIALTTFAREAGVAIVCGLLTFGISQLLAPGAIGTAGAFGLMAAVIAGSIDTLYFHLLFLLREAPVHSAEKHYRDGIEQARMRLVDGSMRLQEALIGRFEADYRRTAIASRSSGHSRRQIREARRQLKTRLWVVDRVIPGNQLVAFTSQAKEDPDLLERWTEEVDWLVTAARQVRRQQGIAASLMSAVRPGAFVRETVEERKRFAAGG